MGRAPGLQRGSLAPLFLAENRALPNKEGGLERPPQAEGLTPLMGKCPVHEWLPPRATRPGYKLRSACPRDSSLQFRELP